jgi:hypothetical protein
LYYVIDIYRNGFNSYNTIEENNNNTLADGLGYEELHIYRNWFRYAEKGYGIGNNS